MRRPAAGGPVAIGVALAVAVVAEAGAQAPVVASPDITARLGVAVPQDVTDEDVVFDDAAVVKFVLPPGTIPPEADVTGYERLPGGNALLTLDVTVPLPGLPAGMPAEPRDVVEYDPTTALFAFAFDGSASGVPANARVDAVAVDPALDLLLSFDVSVTLPGPVVADDEDLVRFAGGLWTLVYDGSAAGVAPALDVDAAWRDPASPDLWLSFDGTGIVGGVLFDDEDVLAFDPGAGTYAVRFDASLSDPVDWPPADLVALPEPGTQTGLGAGAALLVWLLRRRRTRGAGTCVM